MRSSKTMQLLVTAYNYEQNKKTIIVIKPKIDTRFGNNIIKSRIGIERKADIILKPDEELDYLNFIGNIDCILVDECQFLTPKQIEELREISRYTLVIAYGLRTDYRSKLFPGSKRLMEIADTIEEVKTVCTFCTEKSIINMKYVDGKIIKNGDTKPDLGCEEKYLPVCWNCWNQNKL
jgi:thymidine kinase